MELKNLNPLSWFRQKRFTVLQSFGLGGNVPFAADMKGYIDQGYAGSSTVYSIVSIISETFASTPLMLYKVKNKKAFDRYKVLTKQYNPSVDTLRAKMAAMDEVDGHPLLDLLNKPNKMYGGFDFRVHLNASRDITGNCFLWVNRGLTGGDPLDIKVLPAHYINLKTSSPWQVEGYTLNLGTPRDFSTDEVIHWKYPTLDFDVNGQHLFGQSPLKAAASDYTLSTNKEGKKAAAKMNKNQGAGGILSRNEDTPWNLDQRDALVGYVDEVINGNENRGKVRPVNAKVSWVQMAMSAGDMQLIEGLKLSKEELTNAYNFPIHLISATSATDNNYDTANKYLVTKTVYSRLVSFRDFVNSRLLPMYKDGSQYYFDFDISTFPEVQDDQKKLFDLLKDAYWITPEEKREYLGWDASNDPNMKKFYFPSSLVPLDQLNSVGGDLGSDISDLEKEGLNDYNKQ